MFNEHYWLLLKENRKLPINLVNKKPDFCQLKYLIEHTVDLVQQVDNIEQWCSILAKQKNDVINVT